LQAFNDIFNLMTDKSILLQIKAIKLIQITSQFVKLLRNFIIDINENVTEFQNLCDMKIKILNYKHFHQKTDCMTRINDSKL
jgi:hypothetical protein